MSLNQNDEVIVCQDINVLIFYSVWITLELDKRYYIFD